MADVWPKILDDREASGKNPGVALDDMVELFRMYFPRPGPNRLFLDLVAISKRTERLSDPQDSPLTSPQYSNL